MNARKVIPCFLPNKKGKTLNMDLDFLGEKKELMQKAFFSFPKDNAEKSLHCNLLQISSASLHQIFYAQNIKIITNK